LFIIKKSLAIAFLLTATGLTVINLALTKELLKGLPDFPLKVAALA
jgi:hypothetical protein